MSAGASGTAQAKPTRKAPKGRGLRQTMSDLHIWTGLLVGWILYAMFLTGTVSYFRDEISRYMRPELKATAALPPPAQAAQTVLDAVLAQGVPLRQLSISLPTDRQPVASAFWSSPQLPGRGFDSGRFDPSSGQALQARDTQGGDFFFRFHFNFHYMSALWARWIAGLCAMFMLVAIVSGVITHKKIFTDFFTFRWGKGQRSWLDAHAGLSVLGLPFHFMITWSGLVTLMVLYMPYGLQALPSPADRQAVSAEMRFFLPAGKPAGLPAPLPLLAPMIEQAEQRWGAGGVGEVQMTHPGDAASQVAIVRQQAQRVSTTPHYLLFDGGSGALVQVKDQAGPVATTQGVLYGLHLGRFADVATRWLYFLVSLAGTAMVGSGLVLWTVKRRVKLPNPDKPYLGFYLVERLNIAAIAGLSVAMTAFFWFNRLLPGSVAQRSDWEIHGFFMVWAGTLAWALLRPAKRAWVELFWLAAVLLALLPLLNIWQTDRGLPASMAAGDVLFLSVDLFLLVMAALHAHLARRAARRPACKTPARNVRPPIAGPSGEAV
ncbi:PepSY-associated TM helix domain-containing protein [Alcaligenes sp. SDU_A2]|uniref:PepSY-associated TM helix domain-containing protein n=1 Tax=Alcaligenes sp. SDU_A2 TaxID=3136634 RepID=UPI00311FC1FA